MSTQQPNVPGPPYTLEPIPCRHREESRHMILRAAGMVPQHRAIVLGGGRCDEIPLVELLRRFDEVVLNDIDETLVQEAIQALPADDMLRAKLRVKTADLGGATAVAMRRVEAAIHDAADAQSAARAIARELDALECDPFPISGKYDLVVCSCVLAQLHVPLVHQVSRRFLARFPGQDGALAASSDYSAALERLARGMEDRFIDELANMVSDEGLIYLSESTQVCFVSLAPDGRWHSPGTYRMLRSKNLEDYVATKLTLVGRARWEWVVFPPQTFADTGRLFDVQALVLRRGEPLGQATP